MGSGRWEVFSVVTAVFGIPATPAVVEPFLPFVVDDRACLRVGFQQVEEGVEVSPCCSVEGS